MTRDEERERYGKIYNVYRYVRFRLGTANLDVLRDRGLQCFTKMCPITFPTFP